MNNLISTFSERVRAIDWASYATAYGSARGVGDLLIALRSRNAEEALDACGDLWAGLCHQHVYMSSASLPALPFLLEVLEASEVRLQVEIFDILAGLALCSIPPGRVRETGGNWIGQVRDTLQSSRAQFEHLRAHHNAHIAEFAASILGSLDCERLLE